MSAHALAFLLITLAGFVLSLTKHPFWGLLTYIFIYYNYPHPVFNWWAQSLPQLPWSFISAGILIFSLFLHAKDLECFRITEMHNLRWFIALAILMIILLPFAVNEEAAPIKLYEFVRYLIVFLFLVKSVQDMRKFELLIWLLFLCSFNLSWEAFTIGQYRSAGRLEGIGPTDSTDSNMFASVLIACVPFLIREMLVENWKRKVVVAGISVFVFNAIILCNSRGGVLALAIVGISLFFLEVDSKARMKMAVALMLSVIIFISLMDPVSIERTQTIISGSDSTGSGRTEIWRHGLSMSWHNPLGVGGEGFKYLSPQYLPEHLVTQGARSPHNTYLEVLVEQGWFGLILYLCAWGSTIRLLHKIRKRIINSPCKQSAELIKISQYSLAVEGSIIGVLASGFFVDRLYFELSYILAAMATFLYLYGMKKIDVKRMDGDVKLVIAQ